MSLPTVGQEIERVAQFYKEEPNQIESKLSSKDFLAELTMRAAARPCLLVLDVSCYEEVSTEYQKNPDRFFATRLGSEGSFVRNFSEKISQVMFAIANQHKGSDEVFDQNSGYAKALGRLNVFVQGPLSSISSARARSGVCEGLPFEFHGVAVCANLLDGIDVFYNLCVDHAIDQFMSEKSIAGSYLSLEARGCFTPIP